MRVIIGADLVPTKTNIEYFAESNLDVLFGEKLLDIIQSADFRVFNLEVPLTDTVSPIKKCGPNLVAPVKTVNTYKSLNIDLLTLANNHILDQGVQGGLSTINALKENDINYIGAGENLSEATKPYIIEDNDKKIGFYACAEHEFSIANENSWGANPFDPLESLDHISDLKEKCDYVIVLYHGGKEHYRYPSPDLQKVCRKICEKGADLVVCQHSHCIGCEEKYGNSTIVYGQGNFLFDMSESEFWQTSLLLTVDTDTGEVDYIPLQKDGCGVCLSTDENILKEFKERSHKIKDKDFILNNYREFAMTMKENYIQTVCGVGIIFRIINKLSGHRLKKRVSLNRLMAIENYLMCESHNELFKEGLKNTRTEK